MRKASCSAVSVPKPWYKSWGIIFILLLGVLSYVGLLSPEKAPVPPPTPQEVAAKQKEAQYNRDEMDARIYAKHFVGKSLKAPSTADWQNAGDFGVAPAQDKKGKEIKDVWAVWGHVDSQNGFGAMIRTKWIVRMKKVGTSWHLVNIGNW